MSGSVMRISVQELCERDGFSRSVLVELVEHDIARPVAGVSSDDWLFDTTGAHWMERAIRLRKDLDLEWIAVAMLIDLLRQREELDEENRQLKQRLQRFLADGV